MLVGLAAALTAALRDRTKELNSKTSTHIVFFFDGVYTGHYFFVEFGFRYIF